MRNHFGTSLRTEIAQGKIVPFIGVYDTFSATLAGQYYDSIFISGFSFAASYYGLPDIGLISWSDLVALTQRVRSVLPHHHLLVDIDDGYGDTEIACHVVALLEAIGVSGIIIEDQKRPRRCGHVDGKQLLELDQYLEKIEKILKTRKDLCVIARTDADEEAEIIRRGEAIVSLGVDAFLADGLADLNILQRLKAELKIPLVFNQLVGGKSPACTLADLQAMGVSIVNYSTPCLFAAQGAIEQAMLTLKQQDGLPDQKSVSLKDCNTVLHNNLSRRDRLTTHF